LPDWFDGWLLHGHMHNNVENYPFINLNNKFINILAELLNYTPIEIEELISFLQHKTCYNTIQDAF